MASEILRFNVKARVGGLSIDVALETGSGPLVVIGPNGSGKTTLLSLMLGVLPAESGHLRVGRRVLWSSQHGIDVPVEHRRIGYVPQDYALLPNRTARGNIEFALACAGQRLNGSERSCRADLLLAELGLGSQSAQTVRTLSGGERQRLALARALSVNPHALLLDEPLSALDIHSRREVRTFLSKYLERLGLPTLIVTHDAEDARLLGCRIAVLEAGRVSQFGPWSELAAQPATRFVEEFVSAA